MAKLFEELFKDTGSGDVEFTFIDQERPHCAEERMRLKCHSLILTQHPYFFKMLNATTPLREGRTREVIVADPRESFLELVRFIYTNQIDINQQNVGDILALADKYCMDEVLDLCLKYLRDNFDPEVFFTFYNSMALSSGFQERLKEQLMSALRQRSNLSCVTEDERWRELPVEIVEEILSLDELPISSETEVLTLISHWVSGRVVSHQDIGRLLGTFRWSDNLRIQMAQMELLLQMAVGFEVFATGEPRNGSALWDPPLVVHRHEAAGNITTNVTNAEGTVETESKNGEICHQLGPRDYLQQEPGWTHPGVHRCRVTLACSSWFHRERRMLRGSRAPMEAHVLQKRAFECSSTKAAGRERSPSPPPKFQVRMPTLDAFDTFDISQMSDVSDHERVLGSYAVQRNLSLDHEIVDHQIYCGVVSGQQRHGVRISQRDPNAIYLAEDLAGKHGVHLGGTTSSVTFDLELVIGDPSTNGISHCRFALLRDRNTLLEEWFDVSAKVPLRFYFSSASFDVTSSYTVTARWHPPFS